MAEPVRKGPATREADRVVCDGCGWLLPVGVEARDCAICAVAEFDRAAEQCQCRTPVGLRSYFGRRLCICGRLEAVGRPNEEVAFSGPTDAQTPTAVVSIPGVGGGCFVPIVPNRGA
jgi:hypothetical protein